MKASSFRFGLACVLALASVPLVTAAARPAAAPQRSSETPQLGAVLEAVASYLAAYERDILALIAEEDYVQQFSASPEVSPTQFGGRSRRLKSDLLVLSDQRFGWVTFRDVFEVDGRPVRDRDERLAQLFSAPSTNAGQEAKSITDESARFNLNVSGVSTNRTLNVPTAALLFFRAQFQSRSRFVLAGVETIKGRRAAIVEFEEQAMPRIISSPSSLAMRGKAWIEPGSGRVLQTELSFTLSAPAIETRARIAVTYAEESTSKLTVAVSMNETYATIRGGRSGGVLTTTAKYSKFRRFSVDAETAFNVTTPAPGK